MLIGVPHGTLMAGFNEAPPQTNMHSSFRSIGLPELVILFLIALILFGPRAFGPGGPFSK
ncbi:MAG: hypothetical protein DMF98_19575 [Acidobacteria bacterium]|nr:MAG: hypothetical protein DMF98_19575 [Acidobacteriota bacterium]